MSVLIEFAMFPTDKGSSVSEYVSEVIKMIRADYSSYRLTAMGTIVETETVPEALEVIQKAHQVLDRHAERIYASIKMDIRKNHSGRMEGKIKSIQDKIGDISA
jgi:uncharacterized protein (TIGR00106 family)